MIDYIKSQKYQRIGLMHDSTGWGQSGRDTALRLLKEAKLDLVAGPEVFDQNDTDMTPQLTKMQDAKVDFIIAYSLAPAAVQIAKSMQKIGLKVAVDRNLGLDRAELPQARRQGADRGRDGGDFLHARPQ